MNSVLSLVILATHNYVPWEQNWKMIHATCTYCIHATKHVYGIILYQTLASTKGGIRLQKAALYLCRLSDSVMAWIVVHVSATACISHFELSSFQMLFVHTRVCWKRKKLLKRALKLWASSSLKMTRTNSREIAREGKGKGEGMKLPRRGK